MFGPSRVAAVTCSLALAACASIAGLGEFTDEEGSGTGGGAGGAGTGTGTGTGTGGGGGSAGLEHEWTVPLKSADSVTITDVVRDVSGTTFVVGYFTGDVTIDDEPTLTALGTRDGIIVAIDAKGDVIARQHFSAGINGYVEINAVDVAQNGNNDTVVALGGEFFGTLEFPRGVLTDLSSQGTDGFAALLDSNNLAVQQTVRIGPSGAQSVEDVKAVSGMLVTAVLVGTTNGGLEAWDDSMATCSHPDDDDQDGPDGFLLRFRDSNFGQCLMGGLRFGGPGIQRATRLLLPSGDDTSFIVGGTFASASFDLGTGGALPFQGDAASNTGDDLWLAHVTNNLSVSSAVALGSADEDFLGDVVMQGAGTVLLGGSLGGAGLLDGVLARFVLQNGVLTLSTQTLFGDENDPQLIHDIAVAGDNSIALALQVDGTIDLGGGESPPTSGSDAVVGLLDTDGGYLTSVRLSGGNASNQAAKAVDLDNDSVIVAGEFDPRIEIDGMPYESTGPSAFVTLFTRPQPE